MTSIFADTSYFVALFQPRDGFHSQASSFPLASHVSLYTTQWVFAEFANFCSHPKQRRNFQRLIDSLSIHGVIVPATDQWFLRGVMLFNTYRDKEWSLTDCISFEVMRDYGITDALTTDHHFEQAGFNVLLK